MLQLYLNKGKGPLAGKVVSDAQDSEQNQTIHGDDTSNWRIIKLARTFVYMVHAGVTDAFVVEILNDM